VYVCVCIQQGVFNTVLCVCLYNRGGVHTDNVRMCMVVHHRVPCDKEGSGGGAEVKGVRQGGGSGGRVVMPTKGPKTNKVVNYSTDMRLALQRFPLPNACLLFQTQAWHP